MRACAVSGRRQNVVGMSLLLLILTVFTSALSHAQVVGATLTGTVTDPSGAVIAGARLSVTNVNTGTTRAATTNAQGLYSAPNLVPGTYEVRAEAQGLATRSQTGVVLTVGATEVLNLQLSVAQVSEKVQVTAGAPDVDLASSQISSVVDDRTTRELPLNGRDWTQLATLQPGISLVRTQLAIGAQSSRGNRGFGTQLAISGTRPQQNNYRLDGISINDYANSAPGSTLGLSLGVDAIQEFSVVSTNYASSYGLTSGGVVNALTRSGTNRLHGAVYEFIRNDVLDARNYFDTVKPPFRRNQFGGSVGGPIRKDKTFFFADYEGLRQVLSTTALTNVFSPNARQGKLISGTVVVDPRIVPYLKLFHDANGAVSGDTGIYRFVAKADTPEDFVTGRIDHTLSSKDNIHGVYLFDNGTTTQPDALNVITIANKTRRQMLSIEESRIFTPQLLNAVRVGFSRSVAALNDASPGANPLGSDNTLGPLPGLYAPGLRIPGITTFLGGASGTSQESKYNFTTPQVYDDAFWTKGIHSLTFGFAFERIDSNSKLRPDNPTFQFNTLADFITNKPKTFILPSQQISPRNVRQSIIGAYFEDNVRLLKTVTFNVGLRYEPATVPTEVAGKLSNLRTLTSAQTFTGDPFFQNPTWRNFEPRVGFAWDPFGTGKTAVRGGFGIFDMLPLSYQFNLMAAFAAPFTPSASTSALPQGSFPTGAVTFLAQDPRLRATFVEYNPSRSYVEQWNLSVQRELVHDLTLMAAYIGNHGVHLPYRTTDANAVQPTLTAQGYLFPCLGTITNGLCSKTGAAPINPKFGQIDGQVFTASSVYHSLQTQVRKKMSHGFQLQGSFTWAKSLDPSSSVIAGGQLSNSLSGSFFFAPQRGPSDFNIGRNFVFNALWDIATPQMFSSKVPKAIFGGWEVGAIFQASDGTPFTPTISGDPLGLGTTTPLDFPNRLSGSGCESLVNPGNVNNYIKLECFKFPNPSTLLGNGGRNQLTGPGLQNLDFSFYKNIPVTESIKLQFRTEMFNVLNHANFAAPQTNSKVFDAKGAPVAFAGKIDATSTAARQIQFGAKVIW